jgi:hypothetical protein
VQQAFVGLARNRVLGLPKIKGDSAIFNYNCIVAAGEEAFERSGQSLRSHAGSLAEDSKRVCDE